MGLVIRTIIVLPLLFGLSVLLPVGYRVIEIAWDANQVMQGAESVGWTDSPDTVMLFAAISMILLVLVLLFWWIFGDLSSDVRQRQTIR